ncbi:cytochrome c [Bordetella avium]|uniref:Cytochrome C subunit of gluconate dehydrogenase n=1 Tax=Bordetella avium (strain 197N) TaxID=360910 RepID=Q2KU03_BORA1|nr:cytochrome c [Bordetella avium]AZY50573.1 alcohol dehydrogenase [Bordetella avium]RIQ55697.1 cytochrome c [Bordetella avium]RIQ74031.1 cytochrome c [Bordetella avium]CAJ50857.1 putative cytochrome C subunit of gluconate dehydrogenase [Bordetella avium 197N]
MRIVRNLVLLVILAAILVVGFFYFYKGNESTIKPTSKLSKEELILKGKYLARAGDCMACHTSDKGSFAGGVGLDSGTPVGLIYPSNITPDKETGIGHYSLRDFDNALRYGIKKSGESLYPAMPYPSFASVSSEDVEALYAYFMHEVKPVNNAVPGPSGSWPFTMNWPINAWRLLFAPDVTSMVAFKDDGDQLLRGAYLVGGLGHCGTCHTPRNDAMVQVVFSNDKEGRFLSGGGSLEGWNAVNLRGNNMAGLGRMSQEDLVQLLKTGRNNHSAVFGPMAEVVEDSLQHLTDRDITAIAAYLKSLTPSVPQGAVFQYQPATQEALSQGRVETPGALSFLNNCAGCHRTDGKGYAQTFPALAGNPSILNSNADSLISIILRGSQMPGTAGAPTQYAMLGYAWRLDDKEVTDLVNFVRNSWGNSARTVNQAEVASIRQKFVTPEMLKWQQSVSNDVLVPNEQ